MKYLLKDAHLSEDKRYRYSLVRIWDVARPMAMFVGLNPSTADALVDDPTIRREVNFCKDWGYGALLKANLFALRETLPERMLCESQPIGKHNDDWLKAMAAKSKIIVCAWGKDGKHLERDWDVCNMLTDLGYTLHALKLNKDGTPGHPLYLKADLRPFVWRTP